MVGIVMKVDIYMYKMYKKANMLCVVCVVIMS